MTEPLKALRQATHERHRALEAGLLVARKDIGQAIYVDYAAAMLGWMEPLESTLWNRAWPAELEAHARADKSAWLKVDLRAAGLDERDLPRCSPLTSTNSISVSDKTDELAFWWGVAYVIEGAQLGGQVLLRRLGDRLSPIPGRWLRGYGAYTGQRWLTLVRLLNRSLDGAPQLALACRGAQTTFDHLRQWLALRGAMV